MRVCLIWLTGIAVVALSGVVVLSQAPQPGAAPKPAAPAAKPARDFSKLSLAQQQVCATAQRGADWLARSNRPDGRFGHVSAPALRLRSENEHYLRQASATLALAGSAKFFRDERAAALATQSLLTLLLSTTTDDPKKPQIRSTTIPTAAANRLAAAGLLVRAAHELPGAAGDLLTQADQLCAYIRTRQRQDGSLSAADGAAEAKAPAGEPPAADAAACEAVHALLCSHKARPADWKLDVTRKAAAYYAARWRENKNAEAAPALTAALAEAYLATKEQAYADAALEVNDWLAGLQYTGPDPAQPQWSGGFMGWAGGKAVRQIPDVGAAGAAASLATACRVTRQLGDLRRHTRYREALERALGFLATLQYTEGNTQHFADWYRAEVVGAFHASQQDGNIRLDQTAAAVTAFVQYLTHVAELPQ
jgi:hypothetical protein